MNKDLIRSLAKAVGGRVKSFLVQAAKDEAARAVRHFRTRVLDPQRPGTAAGPALAAPLPEPAPGSERTRPGEGGAATARDEAPATPSLDLNTASKDELIALPGIGAARAEAILKGRPFAAAEELVERKILPASVFEALKGRIGA
ncbi:MAG TPA: helix-hairpin-helix domain-containing protein [Microvirga sp.]|jgi:DNA uptake protein ComE-like DNA-binding protein|nr:helix-hairpin-helix domain-containing protein [Microvirga sp.]